MSKRRIIPPESYSPRQAESVARQILEGRGRPHMHHAEAMADAVLRLLWMLRGMPPPKQPKPKRRRRPASWRVIEGGKR